MSSKAFKQSSAGGQARETGHQRVRPEQPSSQADNVSVWIDVANADEAADVQNLVDLILPALRESRDRAELLLRAMLPTGSVPSTGTLAQLRRNAEFRQAFMREFGLLSSTEVAVISGSRAQNPSATATRWRDTGKIFAVMVGSSYFYPAFQFDDSGQPRNEFASLIAILSPWMAGWELAAWLVQPRDDLEGEAPLDLLPTAIDSVIDCARFVVADLSEGNETESHAEMTV